MSDQPYKQPSDNPDDDTDISKSARKREMTALQKLGTQLLDLPAKQFSHLPLSAQLREALELAKRLKQREARRRQLQYIGKLMRSENLEQITDTLARFEDDNRLFRQRFQRLEKIRDDLISDSDKSMGQLIDNHPELDRQHLKQLIRQARKEKASEKMPPAASRKLFKYLRETLRLN